MGNRPHLRHSPSRRGRSERGHKQAFDQRRLAQFATLGSRSANQLSTGDWALPAFSGQQGAYSRNWYSAATGGYIQDRRALGKREGELAKIVIIGGGVIGSSIA